jgi:predicted deacetylase
MDDITPTMDWDRFTALMGLFKRFRVRPLLGVVPDNHDPKLNIKRPHPLFWDAMRSLARDGLADFAQHGYQHLLEVRPGAAMIGIRLGIKEVSEFAGLPREQQRDKIQRGRELLRLQGLDTNYWMAPNHSFDAETLTTLSACGFTALTDGVSLFPFRHYGLICIPQQLWKPIWMPAGVITICIHSNEITTQQIRALRRFLRSPLKFTSFSQEVAGFQEPGLAHMAMDQQFRAAYKLLRRIKASKKSRRIQPESPAPEERARPLWQ